MVAGIRRFGVRVLAAIADRGRGVKVLRKVQREWRSGRGLYWRPDGAGYTNLVQMAGVYDSEDCDERGNYDEVEALPVFEKELRVARERVRNLTKKVDEAGADE